MKPRPYIRSIKDLREGDREKPKFRIVKIDNEGKRKQITVSVVSACSLPDIERAFLSRGGASNRRVMGKNN